MILFKNAMAIWVLLLGSTVPLRAQNQGYYQPSNVTRIVFLGTGTPNPDPNHSGISVAIIVNKTPYIIDCGPGLIRKAAQLSPRYGGKIEALDAQNIKRAFISHLHSDHTAGYPDLILTPWVMGRDEPLEVYGPPGTKSMTDHLLAAYQEDIKIRITGLEHGNDQGWRVNVHEFKPGIIYKDSNITVEAFLVEHGNWPESYGFIFTTPNMKIAISGDTRPSKNLIAKCKNVDVLIHEVYSAERLKSRLEKWQKYHSQYHTSTYELGEIASQIKPGLLILYHQLYWGDTDEDLIKQVNTKWKGAAASAKDLDIY